MISGLRALGQLILRGVHKITRLSFKAVSSLLPLSVKKGLKRAFFRGNRLRSGSRGQIKPPQILRRTGDLAYYNDLSVCALRPWMKPRELEAKLWGGFSQSSLADLDALMNGVSVSDVDRDDAAWALAGWYAVEGEHDRAKICFQKRLWTDADEFIAIKRACLAAFCHMCAREYSAVREIAQHALRLAPNDPNLFLLAANGSAAEDGEDPQITRDEERLAWINRAYEVQGFAPLRKKDPEKPLGIDNLAADATPEFGTLERGKVTVIIPAYNAEHELPLTLDSLLLQTWRDLEIIVVNDCSIDNTANVIEDYAARDGRIVPLQQKSNQGTYAARNAALMVATGDFITVHDAGDWSHPQKIEEQLRRLGADSHLVACYSNMARVDDDLRFNAKFRQKHRLIDWNPSSLMFRRTVLKELGAWDAVRISADSEFISRLRRRFPDRLGASQHDQVPLAFVHAKADSLTSVGTTHGRTTFHGIRREYREASQNWHDRVEPDQLRLDLAPKARPFPAPGLMLPERVLEIECDLLLVGDFNSNMNVLLTAVLQARAAIKDGERVGLFHWRHYILDVKEPLVGILRDMARSGELIIIAAGESVKAKRSIVLTPAAIQNKIDVALKIDTSSLAVIVDQPPNETSAVALPFDPRTVIENLQIVFGKPGTWHASSAGSKLMIEAKQVVGMPQLHDPLWQPLPNAHDFTKQPLTWRGENEEMPRLLAMCEDNPTSFPAVDAELLHAFCADRPCQVTIAGAPNYITARLKKLPSNWNVGQPVMTTEPYAFDRFNFVIHYPAAAYLEKNPHVSILCAMATGLPVIMTPDLETVYGTAAVYTAPEMVWATIRTIWGDRGRYLECAQKGRDFVCSHCDGSLAASLQ